MACNVAHWCALVRRAGSCPARSCAAWKNTYSSRHHVQCAGDVTQLVHAVTTVMSCVQLIQHLICSTEVSFDTCTLPTKGHSNLETVV